MTAKGLPVDLSALWTVFRAGDGQLVPVPGDQHQSTRSRVSHLFRIREIAWQAGVSEATVDRVLHDRPGVRDRMVRKVRQAIADLDRQQSDVPLEGRTFVLDIVLQAPEPFSSAVRGALDAERSFLRPAVISARFHPVPGDPVAGLTKILDRIARRGSAGVILKAPDVPEITAAVDRLAHERIPVVTLATDLPRSQRVAYIGVDNRSAGATAGYLMAHWLGNEPGDILVALPVNFFRGEEEREMGFRSAIRSLSPHRSLIDVTDPGVEGALKDLVLRALRNDSGINAVYSVSANNVAIVEAFASTPRTLSAMVGHDLLDDNARLLRDGRLSAVLYHDLHQDMRRAAHVILQAHGALPGRIQSHRASVQIATPYNMPSR